MQVRGFTRQTFLLTAVLAVVAAVGVSAVTRGSSPLFPTASITPIKYVPAAAPPVSPEEAARAVSSARELSTAFRVASERVLPSVVAVETTPTVAAVPAERGPTTPGTPDRSPFRGRNPFEGTPFEDMFREMPFGEDFRFQMPPGQGMPRQGGIGSGVIFDDAGLILTNNHVVAGGGTVAVRLHDGREYTASQVWTDPKTDIAVIKIDGAEDLVAAPLGNSDAVSIGDWVLALGQPFGLESTVTAGIISAKHRGIGITPRENFLQTDAAINPGNSGGPLVNLDGEVIGVNTAISSRSGGNEGIGFAVPVNLAKWVAQQLANDGVVRRAYLGVGIQPVTQKLADQFKVKPREGVVVTDVFPNTPAAKAGVLSGDVIIEFAGVKVASPQELQTLVEQAELGKPHALTVKRDGTTKELAFTPEEQPNDYGMARRGSPAEQPSGSSQLEKLGMEIGSLETQVAEQLGLQGVEGVVITRVQRDGLADRAGLESGMAITQVNRVPVANVEAAVKALNDASPADGILLLIRSGEGSRFVVLKAS
ncbi:MAG: Do family serine endopeptidase [Pirellulaceae bacterium]|nr:Do family serine endopeptidase [Pirellulaceae bacterium]